MGAAVRFSCAPLSKKNSSMWIGPQWTIITIICPQWTVNIIGPTVDDHYYYDYYYLPTVDCGFVV